jgi:hypothetical protein
MLVGVSYPKVQQASLQERLDGRCRCDSRFMLVLLFFFKG